MTGDNNETKVNIEELEREIEQDAKDSNSEKTSEWETIASMGEVIENQEDDVTGEVSDGDSEADDNSRKVHKDSDTKEAKKSFMPGESIWTDDDKPKGLSGDGEQSVPKPGPSPEDAAIIEKIKERKKQNAARKKREKRRRNIGIIAGVIVVTALILSLTNIFVVDSIEVKGNSHFTGEEIINIGHASAGKNIFYNTGKSEIEENLEDNPYIKSASVKRKLPSTLVIEVSEREEACAIKYDDDYLVLDEDGILLRKSTTEPNLTKIDGLVVSKISLGEKLGVKDSSLLKSSLNLLESMQDADMYFVKIDMSDDTEIAAYIYDTLIVKTSYEKLKENLDNGRLHKVVEKLFEEGIERGTITFNDDDTASFEPGL